MSALWFYQPTGRLSKAVATWLGRTAVHVSIQHAVADVAIVTEAHAWRGVYSMPLSSVKPPQRKLYIEVPDPWVTSWLARRWGVRFNLFDRTAHPTSCVRAPTVASAVLVAEMLRDARRDGFVPPATPALDAVDSSRITPSMLYDSLLG